MTNTRSNKYCVLLFVLQIMPGYYQFRHPRVAKRSVFPDSVHHIRLSKDSRVSVTVRCRLCCSFCEHCRCIDSTTVKDHIMHFLLTVQNIYYLRQVNEVNGRNTLLIRCVCMSACVRMQRTDQSDQYKMVKAADFRFDTHVLRDSPDMTLKTVQKGGVARVTWPPKSLGVKC